MRMKLFLEKFTNLIENENFLRVLISIAILIPLILIFLELQEKIYFIVFSKIFKENPKDLIFLWAPSLGYILLSLIAVFILRLFKYLKSFKKDGLIFYLIAGYMLSPIIGVLGFIFNDLSIVGNISLAYMASFIISFGIFGFSEEIDEEE